MAEEAPPLPGELAPDERLLTLPLVRRQVPMSTATIYRWMRSGAFPRNYKISPQTVVWLQSDITRWKQERICAPA